MFVGGGGVHTVLQLTPDIQTTQLRILVRAMLRTAQSHECSLATRKERKKQTNRPQDKKHDFIPEFSRPAIVVLSHSVASANHSNFGNSLERISLSIFRTALCF